MENYIISSERGKDLIFVNTELCRFRRKRKDGLYNSYWLVHRYK